ncbi:MAG: cytochrome c oxidase subunit 3 [Chloroflexota bacterium]|nr:cytochrome c oxidase subunit 3 [Chloroflexota bacterium]
MTAGAEVVRVPQTEEDAHAAVGHAEQGINTALLGMLLFIGSEVMFFAGLFAAYFNARAAAPAWPPAGLENVVAPNLLVITATTILVISSFTMQWGVWRIRRGDRAGMNRALIVTLVLGVLFLGMQAYDYWELLTHEHFGINSGIYGTLFYTLTGFHGAHVFGGVVGIAIILLRGLAGQFSARHHVAVEAVSAYWHFVDVVWIALFFTLYFLK